MYILLILANYHMIWCSVTFIWLMQIATNPWTITQNLGFRILFHVYIYDVHSKQAVTTLSCVANLILANCYVNWNHSRLTNKQFWFAQKKAQLCGKPDTGKVSFCMLK